MAPTGRYWATITVAASFLCLGVLFESPLLLACGAGLVGWTVAAHVAFVQALARVPASVHVETTVTPSSVRTDDDCRVAVGTSGRLPDSLTGTATAIPPISANCPSEAERTVALGADADQPETVFTVSFPVAGSFSFDPTRLTVEDERGLFVADVPVGEPPTVRVEPRRPRDVHVGRGGDRFSDSYGSHSTGLTGSGITPVDVRPYRPGDAAKNIDWRATARQSRPHVREYEVELDRTMALLFDHGSTTTLGPPGESAFEYLRAVALTVLDDVATENDPLGLYTFEDGSVSAQLPSGGTPGHYGAVRERLLELETFESSEREEAVERTGRPPGAVATVRRRLEADDAAFGNRLRPFFDDVGTRVSRLADRPLFQAARTCLSSPDAPARLVICTTDSNRDAIRETVRYASHHCTEVLVFLAPAVLFESDGLADLESAYGRYVDFEEFRRRLSGIDGVTAFEVGPRDSIEAVLSSGGPTRGRA